MTLMRDFCALSKEKKVPYERWQVKLLFQKTEKQEKCPLKGGKFSNSEVHKRLGKRLDIQFKKTLQIKKLLTGDGSSLHCHQLFFASFYKLKLFNDLNLNLNFLLGFFWWILVIS